MAVLLVGARACDWRGCEGLCSGGVGSFTSYAYCWPDVDFDGGFRGELVAPLGFDGRVDGAQDGVPVLRVLGGAVGAGEDGECWGWGGGEDHCWDGSGWVGGWGVVLQKVWRGGRSFLRAACEVFVFVLAWGGGSSS